MGASVTIPSIAEGCCYSPLCRPVPGRRCSERIASQIIEMENSSWAAIEVKLGAKQIDDAAKNPLKFAKKIDTARSGEPAFLAVVTATGYGYVRADGVYVLPIGTLKP